MKVKELIKKLGAFDGELDVMVLSENDNWEYAHCSSVRSDYLVRVDENFDDEVLYIIIEE